MSSIKFVLGGVVLGLSVAPAWALTLGESLDRALAYAPDVAVSQAQFEADRELAEQERSTRRPQVSLGAGYEVAHTEAIGVFGPPVEDDYSAWSASVQLRQPLFRLDWSARGERAEAYAARAQAAFDERTLSLISQVAEAYFGVLLAQDELRMVESEAEAIREAYEDTRKRYEAELVPGTDLKEAQAQDDLVQARLIGARRSLESAQDTLAVLIGEGGMALPRLPDEVAFPPLQPAEIDSWLESAKDRNLALRQQREAVAIAKADLRSARSDRAPTVDVVATAGRDDTSEFAYGQTVDDARLGLELNMPIYGGGTRSRLRQADAQLRAAQAELQRQELEVTRQVRERFRAVDTATVEMRAYERALASSMAAEEATQFGYEAGTRTITDVLDARSAVVQARSNLNRVRYQMLQSLLQLKQAVGVLQAEDLQAIDRWLVAQ